MRYWRIVLFLIFLASLLYAPVGVPAQEADDGEAGPAVFSLIPILETALNGELRWRPDWPADFPPDGFSLLEESQAGPLSISLSKAGESFSFRRDSAGRLAEFPCFLEDACLQVQVSYSPSGEIAGMSISGGSGDSAESWSLEFPKGAVLSGAAPVKVSAGGAAFFVFFLKSPVSLSETWYDEGGNFLAYYKAALREENETWRVSSLQSWAEGGLNAIDYAFDSGGNTTGIRSLGGRYTALYRGKRPVYWNRQGASGAFYSALQWDEQGLLVNLRLEEPAALGATPPANTGDAGADTAESATDTPAGDAPTVEFRYQYERDGAGNWVSRQDIPMVKRFGVLVPQAGAVWTRQITYGE